MTAIVGAELGPKLRAETQFRSLVWMAGTHLLEPSMLHPSDCIGWKLEPELGPEITSMYSCVVYRHLNHWAKHILLIYSFVLLCIWYMHYVFKIPKIKSAKKITWTSLLLYYLWVLICVVKSIVWEANSKFRVVVTFRERWRRKKASMCICNVLFLKPVEVIECLVDVLVCLTCFLWKKVV